jgi:DNA polymerase-3 subunit epsilon
MLTFSFDTETTGLFDDRAADDAPHQPRLVRIACGLYDDEVEVSMFDLTIRPEGFTISEDVSRIHGITHRRAVEIGVPVRTALSAAINLARVSNTILAYGLDFDQRVVAAELRRMKVGSPFPEPGIERVDVKQLATEWCKIDDKRGGYKWPSLQEAALILCDFETPKHHCPSDMRAAYKVWREIKRRQAA